MCTPNLVSTTHLGCHCPPTSIGTPPTHLLALGHYHHSSPIDSKSIFCGKPCQNRHTFENFRFFVHWACTHTTCTTCPLFCHLGRPPMHLFRSDNDQIFVDFHQLCSAHHLLGLPPTYQQPTTCHLIHPRWATHTSQPADPLPDFHGPVHYIATHTIWGLMPLLSLSLANLVTSLVLHGSLATSLDQLWACTTLHSPKLTNFVVNHHFCSMTRGQIIFFFLSFWVISWCNPWRPMRAQP